MTISALAGEQCWGNDNGSEAGRLALTAWITNELRPRMIVAPDMQLIWGNRSAIALGATSDLFRIQGQSVLPLDKQFSDLCTYRALDQQPWRLVTGADGRQSMIWTSDVVTHVGQFIGIVLLPGNRGCPNALANDFGFTRTEAKVAGLFLNGYSTKQVAVSMGVAVDTVKTHIKHIYEKMSVCNREQFFAKAALFDLY